MKVAILNTAILTSDGEFTLTTITVDEAKNLIKDGFDSFCGHEGTCLILSELLEVEVPFNRAMFTQQPGQSALVFKLRGRPAEGVILTREDIEEIGYDLIVLRRLN